ncbi:uncharacterized protein LOC123656554 [Melitaea cinxia]|uniref:uncharacterized protein LOC123656554 n=1 Tax=Melitaea cinxia TaxID=113334 RepID=UPI001E2730B7|nr:uncharacterized protein LOC123656554 [Melitaea cinxia]
MAKSILDRQNNLETERRNSIAVEAQCSHDHQDLGFKLPQIQISKFDGAYFRWLEFRDTFENLIHNNDRIKPIHKFHYLISYLEGDAARIISNLEVSSINYAKAWQLLGDRYNNKRLLINHHLSSLFNIQAHTRESERSLRFLVDHVTKNLRALASLGQPTDRWDILIIFMLSSKLDSRTLMKWEEYRNTLDDVPTLDQFHKFLIDRADVLEALNRNKYDNNVKYLPVISRPAPSAPTPSNNSNNNHKRNNHTKSFVGINQKTKGSLNSNQVKSFTSVCIICSENHKVFECPIFIKKGIQDRLADVTKYKLCANCLRQGHPVSECRFGPCRECKQKHNSLLHESKQSVVNNSVVVSSVSSAANVSNLGSSQVLLSTAVIEVVNPSTNEKEKVRALLDCGSESSFITKSLKERLSLKSYPSDCLKVIGIGNNHNNNITESCIAQINSLNDSFKVKLSCFVLKELTSNIPKCAIDIKNLNIPKNLPLADPEFNHPASIEVLIGADIFWDLLGSEHHSLGPKNPHLRNSRLGWLISGPINVPNKPFLTPKEQECKKHFMTHTVRLSNGRFEVKLPLTESPDCLGDSYNLAKKRFLNLERKFKRNPALKSKYSEFIREYAELGHLSESVIVKPVPDIIKEEWNSFADNLPFIQGLNITRPIICDSPKSIEMHVFSDASQVAYGSCVYMRSVAANGDVTVKLLCSKSKISPVKPTTIVRLELCAALLAARLSKAVLDSLRYKPDRVLYWSDSSIVLAWLKNNITQLKSFVANRVTEILEITYPSTWRQGTSVAYKWKATRSAHGRQLHALPTR